MLEFLAEPVKKPNATLLDHHRSTTSALSSTPSAAVSGTASPLRNVKILEHLSRKLDVSVDSQIIHNLLNVKQNGGKATKSGKNGKVLKQASSVSLIVDARRKNSGLMINGDFVGERHFSNMSPTFSKKASSRLEEEYLTRT